MTLSERVSNINMTRAAKFWTSDVMTAPAANQHAEGIEKQGAEDGEI